MPALNNLTSTSSHAISVGANGNTNPAFTVDASTGSQATGLKVTGKAAASGAAVAVVSSGANENLAIDAKGSGTITLAGTSTGAVNVAQALAVSNTTTVTSNSATALIVGPNGATNPALTVDGSAASLEDGIKVAGTNGGGGKISVTSADAAAALSLDAKGTGTVTIAGTSTGAVAIGQATAITSNSATALAVGPNGTTNPALVVDGSTGSAATGLKVTSKAAAAGTAVAVVSSGTNEALTIDAKGSGTVTIAGTSTGNIVLGQLIQETAATAITAHAGGGQASAQALTAEINRVDTVATAGDSVKLPTSAAGLDIVVVNNTATAMQVYGAGTDTINGVATATGVSQMPYSTVLYVCPVAGVWYAEGLSSGWSGGLQTFSFANALTAHAGGGQGSALALTGLVNRITTVATAGDSVVLPASAPGLEITVINNGANYAQVFGLASDTINGVASGTGVAQMVNSAVTYFCTVAGSWQAIGLGTGYSGNFPTSSYSDSVTAHAGGGRASAVAIIAEFTRVTTVGTAADSVVLPAAAPGMGLTVINAAATNPMQVFANGSDTIDGTAGATGYSQAAGKTVTYFSTATGAWHKMVSA